MYPTLLQILGICCGMFVHSVKVYYCDWYDKKAEWTTARQEVLVGLPGRERK